MSTSATTSDAADGRTSAVPMGSSEPGRARRWPSSTIDVIDSSARLALDPARTNATYQSFPTEPSKTRSQTPLMPHAGTGRPLKVGIVGAGLMGRQIAATCLERGLTVALLDESAATLDAAISKATGEICDASGGSLTAAASMRDLGNCDVLIETVVEDETVKQAVLSELESVAGEAAVIVSNTSSLSITRLAAVLRRPERFCGLHFCHPMRERRLAEVVRGEDTSAATSAVVFDFAEQLRRVSLLVPDRPGFLLNRLLVPYLNAALELAADGIDLARIEFVARERGMPVGPFTFLDEIGFATALRVGTSLFRAFPERVRPSGLLVALAKGGQLGRQSGAGFFLWPYGESPGGVNPAVDRLIAGSHSARLTNEVIGDRLFLPLAHEAAVALRDGTAPDGRSIATALRHGVGFRSSRADACGIGDVCAA